MTLLNATDFWLILVPAKAGEHQARRNFFLPQRSFSGPEF
jgi:hypothetical protein